MLSCPPANPDHRASDEHALCLSLSLGLRAVLFRLLRVLPILCRGETRFPLGLTADIELQSDSAALVLFGIMDSGSWGLLRGVRLQIVFRSFEENVLQGFPRFEEEVPLRSEFLSQLARIVWFRR